MSARPTAEWSDWSEGPFDSACHLDTNLFRVRVYWDAELGEGDAQLLALGQPHAPTFWKLRAADRGAAKDEALGLALKHAEDELAKLQEHVRILREGPAMKPAGYRP